MEQKIAAQRELWGRIARTVDNLRKAGAQRNTLQLVQATIQLLDKKWEKLEDQHEKLCSAHWEALKTHDYTVKEFIVQGEEVYLFQRATLLEMEQSLQSKAARETQSASSDNHLAKVSLPKVQLPPFSGKYEEWLAFVRDLFVSNRQGKGVE